MIEKIKLIENDQYAFLDYISHIRTNDLNIRFYNKGEFIFEQFCEKHKIRYEKKDYRFYEYDYDIWIKDEFFMIEIKYLKDKIGSSIPFKYFNNETLDSNIKRNKQGTALDLSNQINSKIEYCTLFLEESRTMDSLKFGVNVISIMTNTQIKQNSYIDESLDILGDAPIGILTLL